MSLRAVLIDDHALFREGLKGLLKAHGGIAEFGEAATLAEGLALIAARGADIVTIDLDLPDAFGEDAVARLTAAAPQARRLVVSATEDATTIWAALAAGAHGYVPKRLAGAEAGYAVSEVLAGRVYIPANVHAPAAPISEKTHVQASIARFTPRQREVACAVASGATTKVIAHDLDLSEGAVKLHLSAIYRILGCTNRAQAVRLLNQADRRLLTASQPDP